MSLNPIAPFRDPVRRPRAIIWLGIALIAFIVIWAVAIDGTSTYWFCTRPCHIVHDDNTLAYDAGSHANVACVACHEPVNASGITMTIKKIEVAPDAITTLRRSFELPMNHDNHVALEMPAEQCTQCHNLKNRTVTPDTGLIIDHEAHSSRGIQCTMCHNRVAHPESGITLILKGDKKHDDWMRMNACFRCHGLEAGAKAPGTCSTCHPKDFTLKPPSHLKTGWYALYGESSGHAKAAMEASNTVAANKKFFEERPPKESAHGEIEGVEPTAGALPSSQVNTCFTCHKTSFCADCHQTQMPHPATFKKSHAAAGYTAPQVCAKCHARSAAEATGTGFCNACHHPANTPGTPWRLQHPTIVKASGAKPCFTCHDPLYCETCHISGPAAAEKLARQKYAPAP